MLNRAHVDTPVIQARATVAFERPVEIGSSSDFNKLMASWLGREDSNLDMANWTRMLSPVREEPQNRFSVKFVGPSKRWNFENRTESTESRALERNGPFGEYWARPAEKESGVQMRNRCWYWA